MTAASLSKRLDELAAAALLGTDRAGPITPPKLLSESAATFLRARAGLVPPVGQAGLTLCPEDPLPLCAPAAAAILSRLLAESDWILIGEWGTLATVAKRRVPQDLIPTILDGCATRPAVAEALRTPLGARGQWLADFNPQWRRPSSPAFPPDLPSRWATGTTAERREWLKALRTADPAAALDLIRSTWADDAADIRRVFVTELATGLGPFDEPFLEECLKDRSKGVRSSAASLLSTLPGSRYVARMTERAAPLLKFVPAKPGLVKKSRAKLTCTPPEVWDPSLDDEGLDEKPPAGTGKRAWWLRQILGGVPLTEWTRRFGLAPPELLAALADDDYERDVLEAWTGVAMITADTAWCVALAGRRLDSKKAHASSLFTLWVGLPVAGREAVLSVILAHPKVSWQEQWEILASAEFLWSREFSLETTAALAKSLPAGNVDWYRVGPAFEVMGRYIDTAAAPDVERLAESPFKEALPPSIAKALDRIRLRAEMHKEFAL